MYVRNYAVSAMSAKYIIAGLAASFAIAYASDVLVAQKKIFGGKGHLMTSSYHRNVLNPHVNIIRVTYMVSRYDAKDGGGQGVVAGDG
jgi:hypothetical protein